MPRRSSGPKLWFDKQRGTWTITDGRRRVRTGFRKDEIKGAEEALGEYIGSKHVIKDSATPFIADILTAYCEEHLSEKVSEAHILYDIEKLTKWWSTKSVTEVTAINCRKYAKHRNAGPSARRELSFLRAAIKHWHREHGPLKFVPVVVMPPKPPPRSNFMTRSEAARFLWAARRTPHLVRFFIIGWYTGSRRAVITGLRWSMVDLESGVMLRKQRGAVQTSKRAPPVRIGRRLISHLKRWKRLDGTQGEFIVHFRGKKINRTDKGWSKARRKAKLPAYVTPHVLRHSRATHMMKQRVDPWDAANSLGMSLKVLTDVYGHHHPDWQKEAAETR